MNTVSLFREVIKEKQVTPSMKKYDYYVIFLLISILLLFIIMTLLNTGNEFMSKTASDPTAFFTMVLSIFTILLAFVTLFIWIDSRENLEQQRREVREQADRTIISIGIANSAMGISRDTLNESIESGRRELRAYVAVKLSNLSISPSLAGQNPIVAAQFEIQNFGKTPAYDVSGGFSFFIGTWPLGSFSDLKPIPQKSKDTQNIPPIAPSQVVTIGGAHGLKYVLDEIKSQKHRLYVAFQVCYNDTYGIRHETKIAQSLLNTFEWLNGFEEASRLGLKSQIQVNFEGAEFGNTAN